MYLSPDAKVSGAGSRRLVSFSLRELAENDIETARGARILGVFTPDR